MKLFKTTLVTETNEVSKLIETDLSGYKLPTISGLKCITKSLKDENYFYCLVDDTAVDDPNNHIYNLTGNELYEELNEHLVKVKLEVIDKCYKEEKAIRIELLSKYHDTALVSGLSKYEQSLQLLENSEASAPDVRNEATVRGITAIELANKIITNHNTFKLLDQKISGTRGKIVDRANNFTIDPQDPIASLITLYNTFDILSTESFDYTIREGEVLSKTYNVSVWWLDPNFKLRLKYLT